MKGEKHAAIYRRKNETLPSRMASKSKKHIIKHEHKKEFLSDGKEEFDDNKYI